MAFKEGKNHGKIEGVGYCKVEKIIDEQGDEIVPKLTDDFSENNGCLMFLVNVFKPVFETFFTLIFHFYSFRRYYLYRYM